MRFSLAWVCEHLDAPAPAGALAERLTACGMNVELREGAGDDEVWDVDVTANRPDAMNHRGLAREAAAAGCGALKPLRAELAEGPTPVRELAAVVVEDPHGCPRYCARVVRGVRIGPSPAWLAERLERCGIRPINNVVDATNYVLLDVGHPLHAFDLAAVAGREIRVRRARAGEVLTTLDGVARTLAADDLVIADARRPIGVAGVMGGAESEISPSTREVLVESAYFDPRVVRRTARRLGLATEASHRFERGADREMARAAVDLAAALIARLAGGEVAAGALDSAPEVRTPRAIAFSLRRLDAFAGCAIAFSLRRLDTFAGCAIPREFAVRVLAALELAPRGDGDLVTCTVPSHRVDLELAEDVYEEVLRHFGYDRIPAELPPLRSGPGRRLGAWPLTERAREALVAAGAAEAITFSFVAKELDAALAASPLASRGGVVEVANPLSARLAVMRRSLLAGLVDAAAGNLRRGAERVLIGEVGRVYFERAEGVREEERVALVLAGSVGAWDAGRAADFLDLKGLVEAVLSQLGLDGASWRPAPGPLLAAGEGAEIVVGGAVVGVAGRLADALAAALDVPAPLWVAELDLAAAADRGRLAYAPLPRFPAVSADLTLRHPIDLPYAELLAALRAAGPEWLESVSPLVRYRGEGVGANEVKTTVRLVYRHPDRSLTQDEVNAAHFALMDALAHRLAVSFQ